jgi:hypothetical protein
LIAQQVSNQADAVKIACDFISIENVAETQRICDELRQHRLATGVGEDVLQLYTTLWHAWMTLTNDKVFKDTLNAFSVAPGAQLRDLTLVDRTLRRKEKNRLAKKARMCTELPRPGYDFCCPFCPQMFHRAGLLDHL